MTPHNLAEHLTKLQPGDTVILSAGRYTQPIRLEHLKGTPEQPIIFRGEEGAVITPFADPADYDLAAFRRRANEVAIDAQRAGHYPSQYAVVGEAQFTLQDSQYVQIANLRFEQHWPTHIYIENSQYVTMRHLDMHGATYAIAARGEETGHMRFEDIRWQQDETIWHKPLWSTIHADVPIEPETDNRHLDGGFFTGWGIKGHLDFAKLDVRDAFNGIQLKGGGPDRLSQSIRVRDSRFRNIRDNVLEPEDGGGDWYFIGNEVVNVHKAIALESPHSDAYRNFRISNNRFEMWQRPGPQDETHNSSLLLKAKQGYLESDIHFEGNTILGRVGKPLPQDRPLTQVGGIRGIIMHPENEVVALPEMQGIEADDAQEIVVPACYADGNALESSKETLLKC